MSLASDLDQVNDWGKGEHPHAAKPLSAFQSITAVCDDCGHAAVLDREKLSGLSAVGTFGELWKHAYCAPCRALGATATSVMLHGMLIDRSPEPARSSLDRSDPTPHLPRRSIFNRRGPALPERMIR